MLFSVIIPCYSVGQFIPNSLNSVLDQTFIDYEILVCDDCSTDNTLEILKYYKNRFPDKISIFQNNKNEGAGFTRDKLLKAAKGKYFAFLDGDDLWSKEKLTTCSLLIEKFISRYHFSRTLSH